MNVGASWIPVAIGFQVSAGLMGCNFAMARQIDRLAAEIAEIKTRATGANRVLQVGGSGDGRD